MQRRDVLTALSVMALPVLAGCSDVEFNGDEASITEPLDLVEHDVSTESGTPYDTATVSGELKNTGST